MPGSCRGECYFTEGNLVFVTRKNKTQNDIGQAGNLLFLFVTKSEKIRKGKRVRWCNLLKMEKYKK